MEKLEQYLCTLGKMQAGKARVHLENKVRYVDGKVYTRAEITTHLLSKGRLPKMDLNIDYSARDKAKTRLHQIKNKYFLGQSNENLPEVKEAREIESALVNNEYVKKEYILRDAVGNQLTVSKTMYDFAMFLQKQD